VVMVVKAKLCFFGLRRASEGGAWYACQGGEEAREGAIWQGLLETLTMLRLPRMLALVPLTWASGR
jgi:hypothetical protein